MIDLKLALRVSLCISILNLPLFSQTTAQFRGLRALRFQVDRDLSVYAIAATADNAPAVVFDVSCEQIASKGEAFATLGAMIASGDPQSVPDTLDKPRVGGQVRITSDAVSFAPSDATSTAGWSAPRSEITIKHTSYGEELKVPHGVHVFLHFQPTNNSGNPAWTDGSGAKVLEAGRPKGVAADFIDLFLRAVSQFSDVYRQVNGN